MVVQAWHNCEPLYFAVARGQVSVTEHLIEAHCNSDLQAWDGATVIRSSESGPIIDVP